MPCFIPFRPALRSSLAWACALAARQMALPARADQAAAVGATAGSLDYARAHLPGAINLAWRRVLAERAAGKAAGH